MFCNTKSARILGIILEVSSFMIYYFFIIDLVNQFVYSVVLYLLARNDSFHEMSEIRSTRTRTVHLQKCSNYKCAFCIITFYAASRQVFGWSALRPGHFASEKFPALIVQETGLHPTG